MRIIDITRTVQDAPIYPGSSPIEVRNIGDFANGDDYRESLITAGSHMGTHADAPRHFLPNSTKGIDEIALRRYYGPCRVVGVAANTPITKEALLGRLDGCERLVLHGGGGSYLTKAAAEYIVEAGVLCVVTDALSVAPLDNETQIHTIILGAGLGIVENAVLEGVAEGDYTLCALPVKLGGCDGAPVRAALIAE